jgi:hypothetical protein
MGSDVELYFSTDRQYLFSIVAVHGLNGHREKTWTADNNVLWLRDLLPKHLPNARILSWGYDANTHSKPPLMTQYLYDHATTLISDLCLKRRLTKVARPPLPRFPWNLAKEPCIDAGTANYIRGSQFGRDCGEECKSVPLTLLDTGLESLALNMV